MLRKFENVFVRANQAAIAGMMAVMFILVFLNVLGRYGIGKSWAAAEEVSTFLMIWVAYLGAGLALREGRHAAIDIVLDKLPRGACRFVRAILGVIILGFFGVLTVLGFRMAAFGWSMETTATQIPAGIPYLAIPIGSIIFCLHLLFIFTNWMDRKWEEIEVPEADIEMGEDAA